MVSESRNLTTMLTDIVGFTARTSKMSRDDMMEIIKIHDELIRPVIIHFKGRVVKTLGDAFMSVFESPTNAVICAIMVQYVMHCYNRGKSLEDQIHIRVALNAGDVEITEDGDIYGEAVNVASRLEGVTERDEIYFTEQVYLTVNRNEIPKTLHVRQYTFKGIEGDVKVYRIVQNNRDETYRKIIATHSATLSAHTEDWKQKKNKKPFPRLALWAAAIFLVFAAVSGAAWMIFSLTSGKKPADLPVVSEIAKEDTGTGTNTEFPDTVKKKIRVALTELESSENSIGMKFVKVPAGKLVMGSPNDEFGRYPDEVQYPIVFKNGFYMQIHEITVENWRTFAQHTNYQTEAERFNGTWTQSGGKWVKKDGVFWDNPEYAQTDAHPVTCISYNDIQVFIAWLNRKEQRNYRLPYETEWEYACRAGAVTAFAGGPVSVDGCGKEPAMDEMGWYCNNSGNQPHPAAKKKPNNWGLFDMHGNVWEWCMTWYHANPLKADDENTLSGPESGLLKVGRGGAWSSTPVECRAAYRYAGYPGRRTNTLGFRLLLPLSSESKGEEL